MASRRIPQPPPHARDALSLLPQAGSAPMSLQDFQISMDRRGWSGFETATAIRSLEQRGWVFIASGSISLTAEGGTVGIAASSGRLCRDNTRPRRRVPSTRMPGGLF